MIIKVSSIFKRFGGFFLNKTKQNYEREITISALTRLGMELNGVFLRKNILSIVSWGKTEDKFLNLLSEKKKENALKNIFKRNPPLFLLSKNFENTDILLKINEKFNKNQTAIIKSDYSTQEICTLIGSWLAKYFVKWSTIHGCVVNIFGEGVLIIGDPGVGKTEIVLELLNMNHLFLGDDAIDIARIGNTIIAKPHSIANNFIQIRGIGILNIKEMYGWTKIIYETRIKLIVELKNTDDTVDLLGNFENLGEVIKYKKLLNVDIPHYILPVTTGRNISKIIETAIVDWKLKQQQYNSAKEFNILAKKYINEN